jgi:hypothetical protein
MKYSLIIVDVDWKERTKTEAVHEEATGKFGVLV